MPAEGGGRSDRQTPEESSWEGPAHSLRLGLPHQLFLKSQKHEVSYMDSKTHQISS